MKTQIVQRKNWVLSRISEENLPDFHKVENLKTGFCDNPARNAQGAVAYDFPERIPSYIKDLCRRNIPDTVFNSNSYPCKR